MNSFEYEQESQLSLTKMSILQTHMLRPVKYIDKYEILNMYLTHLRICPHICLGQKAEDNLQIQNMILANAIHY